MMELEARCQELLNKLLMSEDYIKIQDVAKENNISKRSVYYDLCKINDFLNAYKIPEVNLERSKGIYLSDDQKDKIHKIVKALPVQESVYFSPMERVKIIICTIVIRKHPLFIEDFMNYCKVSRNTIINDLKVVSSKLNEYGLTLHYENKIGYLIQGDVIRSRALFFLFFPELAEFYRNGLLPIDTDSVDSNLQKLDYIEKTLDTKFVEETLLALANFIPVLEESEDELSFSDVDKNTITNSYEYKLVNKKFSDLKIDEKIYLTLHLLGSRLQSLPFDVMNVDEDQEPYELAKALVSEFSRIACVEFDNVEEIERSLFVHLKSSLYRYRYGIQLGNPLIEDIKIQYPELFDLTKKAVEYLIQQIGVPINDNEIAYLTLHFGAYITPNQNEEQMNILIVCPNGLSTGNMLRGEVSALVPHADSIDVVSLSEYEDLKDKYDVVISTVLLDDHPNSMLVHPILTDADRIQILKKCMRTTIKTQMSTEDIFDVVKKYVDEDKQMVLKEDIKRYVDSLNTVQYHPLKDNSKGLVDYLNEDTVCFCAEDIDWKKAIHFSGKPLLDKNKIESRYIDAMINQTRLLGPYMFITKDVVLAHAKTEDGVNELSLSMGLFEKEILFPKDKSAKIILVLAAEDQVKHLKILKDIMKIFSNDNYKKTLFTTDSYEEVMQEIKALLMA
ncbi:mannitol operon transcriptional antiterminator [Breznakia sp. PF5-3]|uniref:BglG family transcription antiterminator n=1 Tax=unclassified Breznakia TaxID=2623764 RepID=UPI002406441F|nr:MULTISPECIES: BglG family transcription antiterminator [unclassified Breznakia]MDF9823846.1 mannitol operon transcriptional antiterminator [Breznakia sp. PM6-1]MDF9834588.1 mannitol operon transcriptional antiterminator [Breznakia sp. PF5-3]MDF9836795.1 mannitol operon transcriptional antiterminator [Breznakia sp. PFB2-8]MDF9858756.1 mannitol operon transcriptional antiterminator [Breznakia sp. PH5-24]